MKEDWEKCSLGDLLTLKNGFAFKSSKYITKGIPVIRIGDINDWIVDESQAKCIAEDEEYDGYIVEKDDILIAMSGATTGKFGIYESDKKAYQNQRVGNLKPNSHTLIDKKYIFNLLYSLKFQIEKDAYGGAQPNISAGKIHALNTVLAPLPEQRAIVAKIEELFSDLDKGIADLKKAQDQLKVYRQAVLKKAFEGKLTNTTLDSLAITELGKILTGNTPTKKDSSNYDSADYNFYKPTDLDAGNNVIKSNDFLSKKGFENSRQVPALSILVTCIGATIGKTGLIKSEGGFNQQINAIVPFENYMPEFIFYQAISIDFQTQIKTNASSTTLPILNKGKFSKLRMNVCSLKEQHQIVQEIESRLSVCDKVEESITESLEKAKALRQSILKKAFEGTLLSEEEIAACKAAPDYEPASILLEKIKAEKKKK